MQIHVYHVTIIIKIFTFHSISLGGVPKSWHTFESIATFGNLLPNKPALVLVPAASIMAVT